VGEVRATTISQRQCRLSGIWCARVKYGYVRTRGYEYGYSFTDRPTGRVRVTCYESGWVG